MDPMLAAAAETAAVGFKAQHVSVFVGNIPYSATEEKMIDVCEEIGPVVSFKFLPNKKSRGGARHKGSGFCEYLDMETALSALRNLHGYELYGRHLRVSLANSDLHRQHHKAVDHDGQPAETERSTPTKRKLSMAAAAEPSRTDLDRTDDREGQHPASSKLQKVVGDGSSSLAGVQPRIDPAEIPPVINGGEALASWVHNQLMPEIPPERVWEVVQHILRLKPEKLSFLSVEHQLQVLELQRIFTPMSCNIQRRWTN